VITENTILDVGWYLLYPQNSNLPEMIYYLPGSYLGYSSRPAADCRNPSTDLVGKAIPYYGCVEDARNTYEKDEKYEGVGFNTISISGRLKPSVDGLYDQKVMYGFMKVKGHFRDDRDLTDTIYGQLSFRPVPSSKIIPEKVFGQTFEGLFKDLGYLPKIQNQRTLPDYSISDPAYEPTTRTLTYVLRTESLDFYIVFDRVVLGRITNPQNGYRFTMMGDKIHVVKDATSDPLFTLTLANTEEYRVVELISN
jgi:hypothetical protein